MRAPPMHSVPILEADARARIEEATNVVVDRVVPGTVQAVRRILIEQVIHADVEAENVASIDPNAYVRIGDIRIVDHRVEVGVRRRTTLQRMLVLVQPDRLLSNKAEVVVEIELPEVDVRQQAGLPNRIAQFA